MCCRSILQVRYDQLSNIKRVTGPVIKSPIKKPIPPSAQRPTSAGDANHRLTYGATTIDEAARSIDWTRDDLLGLADGLASSGNSPHRHRPRTAGGEDLKPGHHNPKFEVVQKAAPAPVFPKAPRWGTDAASPNQADKKKFPGPAVSFVMRNYGTAVKGVGL